MAIILRAYKKEYAENSKLIDKLLEECDLNGDSQIDFEEFVKYMQKGYDEPFALPWNWFLSKQWSENEIRGHWPRYLVLPAFGLNSNLRALIFCSFSRALSIEIRSRCDRSRFAPPTLLRYTFPSTILKSIVL